jgi:hypothetical protein
LKNVKNLFNSFFLQFFYFIFIIIDYNHLFEKKIFSEECINKLKIEKENLEKLIIEENKLNLNKENYEKIQKETKNYKNITDSCMKSCSKLTNEIIELKKEIEKIGLKNISNTKSSNNIGQIISKKKNNNNNKSGLLSNFTNNNNNFNNSNKILGKSKSLIRRNSLEIKNNRK